VRNVNRRKQTKRKSMIPAGVNPCDQYLEEGLGRFPDVIEKKT